MNAWLDANADGIALMLYVLVGLAAFFALAGIGEFIAAAAMRRRQRQREALRRYAESIVDRCHWKRVP